MAARAAADRQRDRRLRSLWREQHSIAMAVATALTTPNRASSPRRVVAEEERRPSETELFHYGQVPLHAENGRDHGGGAHRRANRRYLRTSDQ